MITKEEPNALQEEVKTMSKKPEELNEKSLGQVTGGLSRVKRESSRDSFTVEKRKREELNKPVMRRKRRVEEDPGV